MMVRPSEMAIEMKRVLPAAPSVVFAAFTDPGELAKWWGPEGFKVSSLDFDAKVGKSFRIEMQPPEGDPFTLTGVFREVEPPVRVAYTFVWEDPAPDDVETLVVLSLKDVGGATEVTFTQGLFKTETRRTLHRNGWGDGFNKLDRLLRARP